MVLEGSTGRQQAGVKVGRFNLLVENFGMFSPEVKLPDSFVPSSLSLIILKLIFCLTLRGLGWEEN